MQAQPNWAFLIVMAVAGLLALAVVIVATVLIASRNSFGAWRKFKSAFAVMVWVVPAAAVVTLIGMRLHRHDAFVAWETPSRTSPLVDAAGGKNRVSKVIATHEAAIKADLATRQKQIAEELAARQKQIDADLAARQEEVNAKIAEHQKQSNDERDDHQRQIDAEMEVLRAQHRAAEQTEVAASPESATTAPRLKVRQISSDDPKWTTASNVVNGRELVVLSSQRFATLAEAEDNVTAMALQRVREHWSGETLLDFSGGHVRWPQSIRSMDVRHTVIELIDRFAVKDLVGEVMDWDFKNGTTGKMYRAHLRLDFTPQLHDALQESGRAVIVEGRVLQFGGLLGLVTLMLGTAAGYFKLDDATAGAYRRRLKLAAVAVITAGSLVTARVLAS